MYSWLLYLGSAVALTVVTVITITAVSLKPGNYKYSHAQPLDILDLLMCGGAQGWTLEY